MAAPSLRFEEGKANALRGHWPCLAGQKWMARPHNYFYAFSVSTHDVKCLAHLLSATILTVSLVRGRRFFVQLCTLLFNLAYRRLSHNVFNSDSVLTE